MSEALLRRGGGLSRWLDRPQTSLFRRVLLKLHLWVALFSGLYLIVVALSGSAVVFRRELHIWLGDAWPWPLQAVEWLVDLHDNLLLDRELGRKLNGMGGALLMVLVVTGLVLWWPGRRRWLRSLVVLKPTPQRPFVWQLHSALGFWSLAILGIWAFTAVYFAWPGPFEAAIDRFDANLEDFERPDAWLRQAVRLHFGRFGGLGIRWLWVALGLIPAIMFVTGFLLWAGRRGRPAIRAASPQSNR